MGTGKVKELEDAVNEWMSGNKASAERIGRALQELTRFYPEHIRKEDREFFVPAMTYLTLDEKKGMLAEMAEFDRKLIHDHYRRMVERFAAAG